MPVRSQEIVRYPGSLHVYGRDLCRPQVSAGVLHRQGSIVTLVKIPVIQRGIGGEWRVGIGDNGIDLDGLIVQLSLIVQRRGSLRTGDLRRLAGEIHAKIFRSGIAVIQYEPQVPLHSVVIWIAAAVGNDVV